jgi:hypothetical protein
MTQQQLTLTAVLTTALTLVAIPAIAVESPTKGVPTWDVNMANGYGTLVGASPVAARIRFDDGTTRTFSISHPTYQQLEAERGAYISFSVQHNVLYPNQG